MNANLPIWATAALWVVFSCLPGTSVALDDPPKAGVRFQGVLRDGAGAPLKGNHVLRFHLYPTAEGCPGGGPRKLTDDHGTVRVDNGLFTVPLGRGKLEGPEADVMSVFRTNAEVWVEIEVDGEASCPRVRVSPASTQITGRMMYAADAALVPAEASDLFWGSSLRIGSTESTHRLVVESDDSYTLRLIGPGEITGHGARLNFGDGDRAYIEEDLDDRLKIHASERLYLDTRVGIGTDSPSVELDVAGSARVSGSLTGNLRDNFKHMTVDREIPPGYTESVTWFCTDLCVSGGAGRLRERGASLEQNGQTRPNQWRAEMVNPRQSGDRYRFHVLTLEVPDEE